MDERTWLTSEDPRAMLRLATGRVSRCCGCVWCDNGDGTVSMASGQRCCPKCDNDTPAEGYREIGSERKLRLFAVACCRTVWHLLINPRSREAVEVAERYTDGLATEEERHTAFLAASSLTQDMDPSPETAPAMEAADCCHEYATEAARTCTQEPRSVPPATQVDLFRCVFGNPYRTVQWPLNQYEQFTSKIGTSNARCLICGYVACGEKIMRNHRRYCCPYATPAVLNVARTIYDDRDFETTPQLADALEEAGCQEEGLLTHLRGPGPHARGCYAVDLILGKK